MGGKRSRWLDPPKRRPNPKGSALVLVCALGFVGFVALGTFRDGHRSVDLVPSAFVLAIAGLFVFGAIRDLYWWRKLQRVSDEEIAHRAEAEKVLVGALPTLPAPAHTPGKYGYRLTAGHDFGPGYVVLLLLALLWLIPTALAWQEGFGPFTIASIIAEVVMLALVARRLLILLRIRPTDVEVSAHPVAIGERFTLTFTQHGPLHTNSLDVRLVCEEEVRYQVGTDTRTETRIVFDQPLISELGLHIPVQRPFHTSLELVVPDDAMHSFQVPNNVVRWKVITRGDVPNFPDFERVAQLVVLPARPVAGGYRAPGRA